MLASGRPKGANRAGGDVAKAKTKKDLAPVKATLTAEHAELLEQIAELEARYYGEDKDQTRDDEGEPETVTTDRERDLQLLENARDLLDQVERALKKVADLTYGTCASCGKSIEAARLKALPHASLCISCKRKEERY